VARDFYEVLGVAPTSEDVVIRAAYRALMRRYHPDADPASETSERAREINAAYAVLNNPEKRARYDGSLAAAGLIKAVPRKPQPMGMPSIARPGPAAIAAFALLAALVALIAISPPLAEMPGAPAIMGANPPAAAPLRRTAQVTPTSADLPTCDDQAVGNLVRNELFRRAAVLRGRQGPQLAAAGGRALLRLSAEPSGSTQGSGPLRCAGWLALDLPPGLVVDDGRTNLNSEVQYTLAAEQGRVRLAGLTGADAVVGSLATLGRPAVEDVSPPPPPAPLVTPPPATAPVLAERAPPPVKRAAPKVAAAAPAPAKPKSATASSNRASFNCRYASGSADKTVCGSGNLAALDRSLAVFYSQSLGRADGTRKAALVSSNDAFARRRDACRSEACLTAAYTSRMREVSEIMAKKPQP